MIEPGVYRHYKGGKYQVLGTAVHSETLETMVLYKTLYSSSEYPEGTLWVRPATMFVETVSIDGIEIPRFSRV